MEKAQTFNAEITAIGKAEVLQPSSTNCMPGGVQGGEEDALYKDGWQSHEDL
jgi:hypothetical protein